MLQHERVGSRLCEVESGLKKVEKRLPRAILLKYKEVQYYHKALESHHKGIVQLCKGMLS